MLMPPQYAGLAMALSSVSVVVSSMSLKLYKVSVSYLHILHTCIAVKIYWRILLPCFMFVAAGNATRKRLSFSAADNIGKGK